MAFPTIKELCTPAFFYFVISMVAVVIIAFQNVGNTSQYCVGAFSCGVSSIVLIFALKILYIFFWTWILHLICQAGYTNISWFLVLFPFILFFVLIAMIMFNWA